MAIIFGILITLGILSFVVFIHELGHFFTARLTKMKIEEFGIGIPPRAKNLFEDAHGTNFTLNWLPIGGFVRIKGEDPSSVEAAQADSFAAKKWWARSLVLVAGVAMNFILAWFIFSTLFWSGSSPLAVNFLLQKNYGSYFLPSIEESLNSGYLKHDGIEIEPIAGGSAQKFGIRKGDILLKVDNNDIKTIDELIEFIKKNNPMEFTLIRNSDHKTYKVGVIPMNGKIQAYLRYANFKITDHFITSFSFGDSLKKGFSETIILSRVTLDFLGKTVHDLVQPDTPADRELAKEMVAGPIGMGAGMVHLVEIGVKFKTILLMIGFLSVNLGVLNILPFPALDGGRLASTTIMSGIGLFTRKKQTLHIVEQSIHAIGMIVLIGLSLVVAFLDILKL